MSTGMEANVEAASSWLTKAAESGDAEAMVQLAHLLLHQVEKKSQNKNGHKNDWWYKNDLWRCTR
jgi:TPR repeat protein